MNERSVSGELMGPSEPRKQWAKGRECSLPDCATPLSTYNPSDRCSPHRHSVPPFRGREKAPTSSRGSADRSQQSTTKSLAQQPKKARVRVVKRKNSGG